MARGSFKAWLAERHPRVKAVLGAVKHQVLTELRVVRHVGPRDLLRRLPFRAPAWRRELPVQAPLRLEVGGEAGALGVVTRARAARERVLEGGHVFYLPPSSLAAAGLGELAARYPPGSGVKLLKNPGAPSVGRYVHGTGHGALHVALTHDHPRLVLVASALHAAGVGPRLHDLVELDLGGEPWTAYVVEHVEGRPPTREACERGMEAVHELEREGVLRVLTPQGWDHPDFQCPECNGNAWVDARTGAFRYVDFQNFLIGDYEAHLSRLALAAAEATHFGDRSFLRGGSYLYQSVPGLPRAAKRSTPSRRQALEHLLGAAGASVGDRLVLDVGCNVGMMLSQYLALGARWCVGYDMPAVVPHAERLLLALGCTRFSLVGGVLDGERAIEDDVPGFLRPALEGAVVSYLAVRGHVGWLSALGRIPWSFMIYEGHEADRPEDLDRHVAELSRLAPVAVAARLEYRDGDSSPRTLAILRRSQR